MAEIAETEVAEQQKKFSWAENQRTLRELLTTMIHGKISGAISKAIFRESVMIDYPRAYGRTTGLFSAGAARLYEYYGLQPSAGLLVKIFEKRLGVAATDQGFQNAFDTLTEKDFINIWLEYMQILIDWAKCKHRIHHDLGDDAGFYEKISQVKLKDRFNAQHRPEIPTELRYQRASIDQEVYGPTGNTACHIFLNADHSALVQSQNGTEGIKERIKVKKRRIVPSREEFRSIIQSEIATQQAFDVFAQNAVLEESPGSDEEQDEEEKQCEKAHVIELQVEEGPEQKLAYLLDRNWREELLNIIPPSLRNLVDKIGFETIPKNEQDWGDAFGNYGDGIIKIDIEKGPYEQSLIVVIIFVLFHEIGHAVADKFREEEIMMLFLEKALEQENKFSEYTKKRYEIDGHEKGLREDFADSFAAYFAIPELLAENPERAEAVTLILQRFFPDIDISETRAQIEAMIKKVFRIRGNWDTVYRIMATIQYVTSSDLIKHMVSMLANS